jgi:hypothetical protein
MAINLLEKYSRQLRCADAYLTKNSRDTMSSNTKLTTAILLENTDKFITRRMNESLSTTRSDLGDWKRFCLNLTNLAVPSLIANDLVIVKPMASYHGSVAYLQYVAKTDKNNLKANETELNGVFGLGEANRDRMQYTSQAVVELIKDTDTSFTPSFEVAEDASGNSTLEVLNAKEAKWEAYTAGTIFTAGTYTKARYKYKNFDMETVPATDIPTIGPVVREIALIAKPRRIAVRYDQITAFQAQTDYDIPLEKQIAEQAVGELSYEIDTEVVDMLYDGAFKDEGGAAKTDVLEWNKRRPIGISKYEHYNDFLEMIEEAKALVYKRTNKFTCNYMVISPEILPIVKFVKGFEPAKVTKMNGPYKAGEIDGLGVYVSPYLTAEADNAGIGFFGLKGDDMMSAAGLMAPYMAIVPTQLLGTPDGGLSQGFSTWYATALLNRNLLVGFKVVDKAYSDEASEG